MEKPAKLKGTLDDLDQFGVEFIAVAPLEDGNAAIGLRCSTCGYQWLAVRASESFDKDVSECPKAGTSKKHLKKN